MRRFLRWLFYSIGGGADAAIEYDHEPFKWEDDPR